MNFKFIAWFRALGGRVQDDFGDVPCTTYIYDYEPISTFKDRAEFIKKKYNHKFTHNKVNSNFLAGEPNIDNIIFVKK